MMSTATQTKTTARTETVAGALKFWVTVISLSAFVIGINFLGWTKSASTAYTDGYCTAISGTVLNDDTCNVNGTVVPVTGKDDSLIQLIADQDAFANGYCTALGGIAINGENCNVTGKVVTVPPANG